MEGPAAGIGEEWRPVEGWPGYWISSIGRVWRDAHFDTLGRRVSAKYLKRAAGRREVTLLAPGIRKCASVANMMLRAFVGPPPSLGMDKARHLDDNVDNNTLPNLAWGTQRDNVNDAVRNGKLGAGSPAALRVSEWRRGKPRPREIVEKVAAAMRGRKLSEETRAKITASLRRAIAEGRLKAGNQIRRLAVPPRGE